MKESWSKTSFLYLDLIHCVFFAIGLTSVLMVLGIWKKIGH